MDCQVSRPAHEHNYKLQHLCFPGIHKPSPLITVYYVLNNKRFSINSLWWIGHNFFIRAVIKGTMSHYVFAIFSES